MLSGYALGTGGFNNAVGALGSKGYIDRSSEYWRITDAGVEALGDWEPLPIGRELGEYWLNHPNKKLIGKAEREHLRALMDAYPDVLTRDEVANRAGYTPGTGGSNNALGKLRTLELIEGYGEIRIAEELVT